jgi:EAL domain-containing protein (putative c-di-GMP-specific phosphodiesterase class I)/FixJ family two-component response regulator
MKKPILLLVDDEPNILLALERLFEDDGYEIYKANSGAEGLKLLTHIPAQVIISDQRMPQMSGTEFLTEVKKLYPHTVRIILSGFSEFEALKSAINDGAIYQFMNKPWDEDLLKKTVHEAFLINFQTSKKEQQRLRLINFAILSGLDVSKYSDFDAPLEEELQNALENKQFIIQYQPIVFVESEQIYGAEALIYWQHPEKGLLGPDYFIPLAEETGIIVPITTWLLNSACKQLKEWHSQGHPALILAINLTSYLVNHSDLIDVVTKVIESTQISPTQLELEITESLVMHDIKISIPILQQLRDLSIKISIDDFGTGHSSLSYLHNLPVNILKIDKSFMQNTLNSTHGADIINSIVKLAKTLKLSVITEGVETKEQLAFLKEIQCDLAQGYLFSKPVNAAAFTKLLVVEPAKK